MDMEQQKYLVGNFIEIDDGYGGRKVAIVGSDGYNYIDLLDVNIVNPIIIHPHLNPRDLGTQTEFLESNHLLEIFKKWGVEGIFSDKDSLFSFRVMWCLRQKNPNATVETVTAEMLAQAIKDAQYQEDLCKRLHKIEDSYAKTFLNKKVK